MPRTRRRKCCHCGQLYDPDPRNCYHQRYCGQPACRRASKAVSQRHWRASPKGKDYFRGLAIVNGSGLAVAAQGLCYNRGLIRATGGSGARSLAPYKITACRKSWFQQEISPP